MVDPSAVATPLEVAEDYIATYNADDLVAMRALYHPDVRVIHHNRGVDKTDLDLIFAGKLAARKSMPDKLFHSRRSITAEGPRVVIEHSWSGNAVRDFPGFAAAGERVELDLCTVITVHDGLITAYDDYG